ncbi:hypothetical protein SNOG_03300 [Parastagonospora nodorum SN15]|uniref:Uncharacterized protein n=1 Tax=Phaeosphaeria nodorum (strain SN15 / ATCC MYA-4574 / FGSC 10173) TaxID=321614 RepID=Q0UY64_PHANO|nr:hypothetical protein SNOG_03300 [Parastagonospora nodorum SN15]EAT90031.1 hypothetical protein SNOG_03300 [Parastagonospora nodorum SN15]
MVPAARAMRTPNEGCVCGRVGMVVVVMPLLIEVTELTPPSIPPATGARAATDPIAPASHPRDSARRKEHPATFTLDIRIPRADWDNPTQTQQTQQTLTNEDERRRTKTNADEPCPSFGSTLSLQPSPPRLLVVQRECLDDANQQLPRQLHVCPLRQRDPRRHIPSSTRRARSSSPRYRDPSDRTVRAHLQRRLEQDRRAVDPSHCAPGGRLWKRLSLSSGSTAVLH